MLINIMFINNSRINEFNVKRQLKQFSKSNLVKLVRISRRIIKPFFEQ